MTKNLSDESDVRASTAPFQAEFPYERDEEAQVTRREFCNFLGLTSAALFIGATGFATKAAFDAREVEERAYLSWIERGCPMGSPEEDWYRAERELIARFATASK